ncbi:hypothetical protein K490DRAFT_31083 [Saccharata proteae CBS 121410]|uniref:DUF1989 domain-containing protein n=1 Tax=Saccharata proteae CBS 121410 TaxID=1314787 RepID=A0A9P4I426_9PEZI|nr:hypothetical protein K490DRAFT_31083 [Saccharata proteae CBS 121410]
MPSPPALQTIPARRGAATLLRHGQTIKITNTHGHQVIDTWAFALPSPSATTSPPDPQHTTEANLAASIPEYTSMSHTRASLLKTHPVPGDSIYSQRRQPLLTLTKDTSPGIHDTLIAACDRWRYQELGVRGWHANCTDNCWDALAELAAAEGPQVVGGLGKLQAGLGGRVPDPFNLFMNIPLREREGGGYVKGLSFEEPVTGTGDAVWLRAERDVVVVMSACPQDVLGINGGVPMEAHFEVLEGEV